MIFLAAGGKPNKEISHDRQVKPHTVGHWRLRFAKFRVPGIEKDLPRGGRPREWREEMDDQIIRKTTQEKPEDATHWSTRTLANFSP
jgi:hypothetical protein